MMIGVVCSLLAGQNQNLDASLHREYKETIEYLAVKNHR